jgi:hypothetical protein
MTRHCRDYGCPRNRDAYGYDAQTGEFGNLVSKGIIDPTNHRFGMIKRPAIEEASCSMGIIDEPVAKKKAAYSILFKKAPASSPGFSSGPLTPGMVGLGWIGYYQLRKTPCHLGTAPKPAGDLRLRLPDTRRTSRRSSRCRAVELLSQRRSLRRSMRRST